MTYTNATKDTYIPPACSNCGAPTDVEWVSAALDEDSAEAIGEQYLPPGHPDRPILPGHTVCSARCWEDGHVTPPCPRCAGLAWAHWADVTEYAQVQRSFILGMHECVMRCWLDLSDDERRELHALYPGWKW